MKYLYISLLLFIAILFTESNKNTTSKIVYKIKRTTDKSRDMYGSKKMSERLSKVNDGVGKIVVDFSYTMYFDKNESIYKMDEYMPDETVSEWYYSLALFVGGKGTYYQNKEKFLSIRQYFDEEEETFIRVKDTLYKNWTISSETKMIDKYKVRKATWDNYVVWFTTDIPVPFGPKGLGGLPGLILFASDGHFDIYADKIFINSSNKSIKVPAKGKIMTISEKKAWDAQRIFRTR